MNFNLGELISLAEKSKLHPKVLLHTCAELLLNIVDNGMTKYEDKVKVTEEIFIAILQHLKEIEERRNEKTTTD